MGNLLQLKQDLIQATVDNSALFARKTVDLAAYRLTSSFFRENYITSSPTIIDVLPDATQFVRKIAKQPVFEFMLTNEDDNFYINTHGVSIINDSFTNFENGRFYILNKNSIPIYFNSIEISGIKLRDDSLSTASIVKNNTISDGNFIIDIFTVRINNIDVGELEIRRLDKFENNKNVFINPFQSVEFSAKYKVKNVNDLNQNYFGRTNKSPNRKKGMIDINLRIKCYGNRDLTREINDTITISFNTINNNDFIINSTSGIASGTTQQYLKYQFTKPPSTEGSFKIEKNNVTVLDSTANTINSSTDISILPGDLIRVTITPLITTLTSQIVLRENNVTTNTTNGTNVVTYEFTVLNNKTYEIISYLDTSPIIPVVRYQFTTNNSIGGLKIFRNNIQIINTSTTTGLITIPGLDFGDDIYARVEPSSTATSSLSVTGPTSGNQIINQASGRGNVIQSPIFKLQSGGVYNIIGSLSPAPIRLFVRHEANTNITIYRNNVAIYTSNNSQLTYTQLQITPNVGDVFSVGVCSSLTEPANTNVNRFDGVNTVYEAGIGVPSGGICIDASTGPDFSVIAGNDYFIEAFLGMDGGFPPPLPT
jgi:hypothetical protein